MPRSPAAQLPAGRLCSTWVSPQRVQFLAQLGLFVVVGKEILDRVEAGGLGGGEPIEERQLVEEHGEIGGKSEARSISPLEALKVASGRQQRAGSLCARHVIERKIEHLLEFDDVVDLGSHRDIGDPFENELHHDGHPVLRHQLARGRERGLRLVRVRDPDRLAAEPFRDGDVVDTVDRRARAR